MTPSALALLACAALPIVRTAGGVAEGHAILLRAGERAALAVVGAPVDVRWSLLVPVAADYDNVRGCGPFGPREGCAEVIRYVARELAGLRGRDRIELADEPELRAPGTHLLVAHGADDPRTADATDAFQVVVRRGDGYVGHLTELLGVPFVLGPATLPGRGHQTDLRLGADCVALVIYGRRRLGERVPYVAPPVLLRWLVHVGSAPALKRDDGAVAPLRGVRAGDVLHFGFQTAVLAEDLPPVGVLDAGDRVVHTYHGVAEEVRLGALPYAHHPVQLLRWPVIVPGGDAPPWESR